MAKGLGKIILTSSVLAGAALGSYMYFKKEGVIDEAKTPAENAIKIRDKVTADAAEFLNRDRSYVDLNDDAIDTPDEVKETASDTVSKVKEAASEAFGKAKELASEAAVKAKEVVAEAKKDTEEALAKAKEAVKEEASEVKEKAEEKVEEAKDTFEPGLQADKINAADSKTIGSMVSEEFFNDEA